MKGLFRSKITLFLTFVVMAALCVYLNLTAESLDYSNVVISGVMFAIVFAIFCFAFAKMATVDGMIEDLEDATEQIRGDFQARKQFLWDSYRNKENLFTYPILRVRYKEYTSEILRMEELSGDLYRCDIEDYINQDLLDDSISRNVLNLVSSTMTGLGILGTFIGLTLGLQQFNTGTAAEITGSIAPLIQGIKVAFQTSIYGMVFSLVFSFVYKNKLDQSREALERFLDAYENFVMPDAKNEGFRQMLALQQKQAEGMGTLVSAFGERLGERLAEIMGPHFDRMNDTINNYASVASAAQVEGLEKIVDKFVQQMDASLKGSFSELSRMIGETVEWEKQNRAYMHQILDEVGTMTRDLGNMASMTQGAVEHMNSYVVSLDRMQGGINNTMHQFETQIQKNSELNIRQQQYIEEMVGYEKQLSEDVSAFSSKMAEQLAFMQRMESKISEISRRNIEDVSRIAQEAGSMMAQSASESSEIMKQSAMYAANTIAESSSAQMKGMIETSGTAGDEMKKSSDELRKTVDAMSRQLSASIRTTYDTIDRMEKELEGLVYSMDVLRRNTVAGNRLKES